jgi:hypothetical protein
MGRFKRRLIQKKYKEIRRDVKDKEGAPLFQASYFPLLQPVFAIIIIIII